MVTLDIKTAARESLRSKLSTNEVDLNKVNIEKLLEDFSKLVEPIAQVLPARLTPSELVRRCVALCVKYEALERCTRKSLVMACIEAVDMGLTVDTPAGLAYVLAMPSGEAKLMVGYQGFIQLGYASGKIAKWELQVVHEKDVFKFSHGTAQFLVHTPAMKDRGEIIAVYSLVTLDNDEQTFLVFSRDDIERIRALSGNIDGWAWTYYYDAMAKAKVAKHHSKSLPKSDILSVAAGLDDEGEVSAGHADVAKAWDIIEAKWAEQAAKKSSAKKRGAKASATQTA